MTEITKFNIRVYGLFINEKKEILLADELRFGRQMTKFPGGGLHFGEGVIDCLKRELREETGLEIEVIKHFYTTDFFQRALFFEDQQLLSVYYHARFRDPEKLILSNKAFAYAINSDEPVSFRYAALNDLAPDDLSFPIDRHVLEILKKEQ
ncbi:MAG: NUDIX hydrolase [Bacteroidales bacterium]|nr:NUDIX hydrolase [Bacteroidales bacterium]